MEDRGPAKGATATQGGRQSWLKTLNPEAAARKEYAAANVSMDLTGKVTIGEPFRTALRGEGFTDAVINYALVTCCSKLEGSDPERWMKTIRTYCGYARDRAAKNAKFKPRNLGGGQRSL